MGPLVRIAGADFNGSDLTLPANWTDDGRGLITETPLKQTPLAAGPHKVHISLNGQQYSQEMLLDNSVSCSTLASAKATYMQQGSLNADLTFSAQCYCEVYIAPLRLLVLCIV